MPNPSSPKTCIAASLLSLAQSLSGILEREGRGARLLEAAFFRADGKVERIAITHRRTPCAIPR